MRDRCNRPKRNDYKYYGGKGIKSKWASFKDFHKDMWVSFAVHADIHGTANTTLDRVDTNKHYCKENCRWATRRQQSENSSRPTMLKFKGKIQSISAWAEEMSISRTTIIRRLTKYKLPVDVALTRPVKRGANQYGK